MLAFNKRAKILLAAGLTFLAYLSLVLWYWSKRSTSVNPPPRLRYAVIMLIALFTRGLCCLLAVDEAQYGEKRDESYPLLPLLVFDAPVLLTLVASVDLAAAQLRSYLAVKDLQRRGVMEAFGGDHEDMEGIDSNEEKFIPTDEDYDLFKCCRNTWIGYPSLNRHSAGKYARLISFLICASYVILNGTSFGLHKDDKKRNQEKQEFFIVVDVAVALLVMVTTCAEQSSGALFIVPRGTNRRGTVSLNSTTVRENEVMQKQWATDFKRKSYRNKHLLLFITVFIFLLLRAGGAIGFADKDTYDEFTQAYKYLIVELGIEFLFYILFFGLVIELTNFYKDDPENPVDPLYLADMCDQAVQVEFCWRDHEGNQHRDPTIVLDMSDLKRWIKFCDSNEDRHLVLAQTLPESNPGASV